MDEPTNLPAEEPNKGIGVVAYKPWIGMKFSSEDEAYDFYNTYGGMIGFGIRRSYSHKRGKDKTIISQRTFVCCKEGNRSKDKRDNSVIKPRAETRTKCLAKMSISRLSDGSYECRSFVEEHNHELHTLDTTHFIRSQRAISGMDALHIKLANESGIKPKASFEYFSMQVGGKGNLGYTRVDLQNYLQTKRQRELAYGEAGFLSWYFESQTRENPSFTSSMQYDNKEQITNIFWADPRMIVDYTLFGDVVSFDTTFCTNKEYRPLGIFAGFNHHRGVCIFGAALLYDETTESFKWLFERFLETHGHKKSITIFTDQDPAMSRAISEVLTGTRHGLCTWHLMQNAIKNCGNLMKEGSSFLTDLKQCVYEYEEVEEFETAWKRLRSDYPTEKTSWLEKTYEIKEKWAWCYMKSTVTLGVRSTQLSESFNADLKDCLSSTDDFPQFFKHFERVVNGKRENELKAEFEAKNKVPRTMGSKGPILRQAGKVYTPHAYNEFLEEYNWKDACIIKSRSENEYLCEYEIGRIDEDGEYEDGEYEDGEFHIAYEPSSHMIHCSCKKFETYGLLCCHALKIFAVLDVQFIPGIYILSRWTRAARSLVVENSKDNQAKEDARLDCTKRFRFLVPKYIKILTQACNSVEGFDLAITTAEVLCKELEKLGNYMDITEAPVQFLDTDKKLKLKKKERVKGGKRHKSCLENQRKKRKTEKSSQPPRISQQLTLTQCSMPPIFTTASSQVSASTPALTQVSLSTVGPSEPTSSSAGLYQHFC